LPKKHSVEFSIASALYSSFTAFVLKKNAAGQEVYLSLNTVFLFSFKCDSFNRIPKNGSGFVRMILNNLAKLLLT